LLVAIYRRRSNKYTSNTSRSVHGYKQLSQSALRDGELGAESRRPSCHVGFSTFFVGSAPESRRGTSSRFSSARVKGCRTPAGDRRVRRLASAGRCPTSLRGGNRGPGWTGWCRRLWGFDGLAFGVDGGEVGAISVIWPLGASTRWLFAGLAVAFEGNWRAPWGPWRGIEQSGAVAGGKDGVF
jgi:hypothetical protein